MSKPMQIKKFTLIELLTVIVIISIIAIIIPVINGALNSVNEKFFLSNI